MLFIETNSLAQYSKIAARIFRSGMLAAGAATLLASCGSASSSALFEGVSGDADVAVLVSMMQSRNRVADRGQWYRNLEDAYPSDGAASTATEVVLIGDIEAVEAGRAFISHANPAPGQSDSTSVDWNDPSAMWRTIHMTVQVRSVLAGRAPTEKQVVVGLVVSDADVDAVMKGVTKLGRVGLFLGHSVVFAYDARVYWIVGDGSLLAVATQQGYALPFLDEAEAKPLRGDRRLTDAIKMP